MARKVTAARLPDLSTGELGSVLVVRLKALGDIVLSLPIVYALRERFPASRIRYLCRGRYAEALAGVQALDEVLVLPETAPGQAALIHALRRAKIDCVLDLMGSPRSALITRLSGAPVRIGMDTGRRNWCYTHLLPRAIVRDGKRIKSYTLESNRELIRMLGLKPSAAPRLDIGFPAAEPERPWAREYVKALGAPARRIVGIVPGSVYQAKSWPESSFIELARLLAARLGALPLVLWGPGEKTIAERVVAGAPGAALVPPMGVAKLGALIAELDCLVGVDSGPKHLAVVQGTPTVTLFGPTDPRIWDPMTATHRAISLGADCFPCRRKTCVPNRCLSGISPDMVMKEVAAAIDARNAERADAGRRGCT